MTLETLYYLDEPGYAEVVVYQSSGDELPATAYGNASPEFWFEWEGA